MSLATEIAVGAALGLLAAVLSGVWRRLHPPKNPTPHEDLMAAVREIERNRD